MSGTSADGVTAALVKIGTPPDFRKSGGVPNKIKVVGYLTTPYSAKLQRRVLDAASLKAPELARLNVELGEAFAVAAKNLLKKHRGAKIAAVGSHGQTIWHGPDGKFPATLQLAEPSVIAERLGLTVVADFRPRDVAAGGQGAPLVPFFDNFVFGSGPARALQNIGGIGNVSVVGRGVKAFGFDTGPGNCLIDIATSQVTRGRLTYDKDGKLARRGRVREAAARHLLEFPYFQQHPPKSADRSLFGPAFLKRFKLKGNDLIATVTYFTALTIAHQYKRYVPKSVAECIVSGGGLLNPALMEHLAWMLPIPVLPLNDFGVPSEAKEAACFALLAERTLAGKPGNLPLATGARGPRILGKIVRS
jgi:anhydro-N-acetylmuramic acid kinase